MALWGFWILALGVLLLMLGLAFALTIKNEDGTRPTWPIVLIVSGAFIIVAAIAVLYVQFNKTKRELIREAQVIIGAVKVDISCATQRALYTPQTYADM